MKVEISPETVVKKPVIETRKLTTSGHPTPEWIAANKITLSNGMEFIRIPAGEFLMGSDEHSENESPQHIVNIPYDYWMARFPVTNELFSGYTKDKGIKHPVKDWWGKKIIQLSMFHGKMQWYIVNG